MEMVIGGPPIVEYWMEKCMILRRFELLENTIYRFLKAQGSNLHVNASIGRHIFNGGLNVRRRGESAAMRSNIYICESLKIAAASHRHNY